MIIAKTPFRISFFGGGTDFENYFLKYGGAVLSVTIDKYSYVTVRKFPPFFNHTNQLTYSIIERVNNLDDIIHPSVRESLKYLNIDKVHITYDADLPAKSGLGTSSSFTVGLLNALHILKGQYTGKMKLAEEAIYVERVLCNESGGVQDQLAVAHGGLNKILFDKKGYRVETLPISHERIIELENHLMLFFTGFERFSFEITNDQNKKIENNIVMLNKMKELVDNAVDILISDRDIREFGQLLDNSWKMKKSLSNKISNKLIDDIYEKAIGAGALGGKILGAGGGGFILFFVEPEYQMNVREVLNELLEVPFSFEFNGTEIIYYNQGEK